LGFQTCLVVACLADERGNGSVPDVTYTIGSCVEEMSVDRQVYVRLRPTVRSGAVVALIALAAYLTVVTYRTHSARSPGVGRATRPECPSSPEAATPPMQKGAVEEQDEPPVVDPLVAGADDRLVNAMIRVPVDKWHAERVENIRGESVQQLVEHLANFDDMHLAMTTVGTYLRDGTYDCAVQKVSHLFRVRRLLALESKSPGALTDVMTKTYTKALDAWPAAYRDWTGRCYGNLAERRYEPLDVEKAEIQATVATYLLGESASPAALGALLDGYHRQETWVSTWKRALRAQCPVPPAFTLYAMHRLVSAIPEGSLRPAARSAQGAYLSWAKDHIPSAAQARVSAWNAAYDESDMFRRTADPGNVLLRNQPKMVMRLYPRGFKDGSGFEPKGMPELSKQGEAWRDRLFSVTKAILEK